MTGKTLWLELVSEDDHSSLEPQRIDRSNRSGRLNIAVAFRSNPRTFERFAMEGTDIMFFAF